MLLSVSELRRLIREALIDVARAPRGPNSHDDAEDRSLDSPAPDRENRE